MNVLVDVVKQYDDDKKKYLVDIWTKVILEIAKEEDPKKILSFLSKVGIIDIDENKKLVHVWVSNEFVFTQVKKFFNKLIKKAIHHVYNSQFDVQYSIYTPFGKWNDLLIDLKKVLNIKENKQRVTEAKFNNKKTEVSNHFGIVFEPAYSFDNFVIGATNNFAFSAAKAVSESPWNVYNPLFLYWNVGLGKTHLMQSIWNYILTNNPDKIVVYLPAVKLIDEIIKAVRNNKMDSFIKKFENIDVLMIDDIQFLANKDRTQEIFHNIFNDFHMRKKQIVLSSDRPPKELLHIEPRLKSRFALWIVVDIKQPDYETRIAILQSKLEKKQEQIDFDVLSVIAEHIKSNVRELEWALNILITKKKLLSKELEVEDAMDCLQTLWYGKDISNIPQSGQAGISNIKGIQNFGNLVEMVCEYYWISVSEVRGDSRKKEITQARQMLMLLAKRSYNWTYEKTWDYFGWKNHAAVIYAVKNVEKKLKTDKNLLHDYNVFMERVAE